METENTTEGSSRTEQSDGNHRLRELDWRSLPCVKLPPPSLPATGRRKQKLSNAFEVQGDGWRLRAVEKLPLPVRPDPAFRFIRSCPVC